MASLKVNTDSVEIVVAESVPKVYKVSGIQISRFVFDNDTKSMSVHYRKRYKDDSGVEKESPVEYSEMVLDYTPKIFNPSGRFPVVDPKKANTDYSDLIGKNFNTFQSMCEILYGIIVSRLGITGEIVYGSDLSLQVTD